MRFYRILPPLFLALDHTADEFVMTNLVTRFNSAQYGFLTNRKSLVTQLVAYIERVSATVDSSIFTDAAYSNFA